MRREICYIDVIRKQANVAGPKAQNDIAELCRRAGYRRLVLYKSPDAGLFHKAAAGLQMIFRWIRIFFIVPKDAIVLYQHPTAVEKVTSGFFSLLRHKKRCRFICIIHDLESLRGGINSVSNDGFKYSDDTFLKQFDVIICHNDHMRQYLMDQGFPPNKLVCLEIFDYLVNDSLPSDENGGAEDFRAGGELVIAGSLDPRKTGYIYKIIDESIGQNNGLKVNLYGSFYEAKAGSSNLHYCGSFPPEELPGIIKGSFGLIWDGPSVATCTGNTGRYLKYNNPHKTSLYLAAGMPVVVWSEAAIADFVLKNGVGISVNSLENLEEKIASVDKESYVRMCENAEKVGKRLREGCYFRQAMNEALKKTDL